MQWVAGSFPIFCALHIVKHSRGFTVLIYAWEISTEPKFLCLLQVDREYRVQKALFSAGFPVPEPLLYCSDVSIIGTEFYVMQHVQVGPPVWQILSFSILQAAFKLSKTFLLEPYQFCDMSINNRLIFLSNASYLWFSQISASPGLISHFVEHFSSCSGMSSWKGILKWGNIASVKSIQKSEGKKSVCKLNLWRSWSLFSIKDRNWHTITFSWKQSRIPVQTLVLERTQHSSVCGPPLWVCCS